MFISMITMLYTACFSIIILFTLRWIAYQVKHLEVNYKGNKIPISSGILIPILLLFLYPVMEYVSSVSQWSYYCFLTAMLGIIGFIDDRFGSKEIKGIKGHLLHLVKNKRISTGLVKLVFTVIVGLSISSKLFDQLLTIIVCTLTFAIWTNIINLLDVRPGRAIKGFWLLSAVLLSLHFSEIHFLEGIIILLSAFLFIIDIFEWGMLGDSGSNILGGIIGFWILSYSSNIELYVFLLLGSFLTFYAEKKSFSQWIEKHPMIQRIDHWGRRLAD